MPRIPCSVKFTRLMNVAIALPPSFNDFARAVDRPARRKTAHFSVAKALEGKGALGVRLPLWNSYKPGGLYRNSAVGASQARRRLEPSFGVEGPSAIRIRATTHDHGDKMVRIHPRLGCH